MIFLNIFSCAGLRENKSDFVIENEFKKTFSPTVDLVTGDILEFQIPYMANNEVFLVQKCGTPCTTAKLIKYWKATDLSKNEKVTFTIVEPGNYYFWIQRKLSGGEVGPVLIKNGQNTDNYFQVNFVSGTIIKVIKMSP